MDQSLSDPSLYLNRELSWLDFNDRVLQLAEDERVPLLERVKFCAIYTTNLDEYYMVRVAGLRDQIDAGVENPSQDGLLPSEVIALIRERVLAQSRRLTDCFEGHLRPALGAHDIRVVGVRELDDERRAELAKHFQRAIFPALTPLAVAPGRPFPYISNLSLSLAVLVRDPTNEQTVFARVKVPTEILPRFVTLKQPAPEPALLVPLEDVIANHLDALFPGMEIADYDVFRVTRDADLEVSDDAADLLQAVEDELRRRRFGEVVRVEIGAHCSEQLREALQGLLGVQDDEVYPVDGLLDMGALWQIVKLPGHNELREEPIVGITHPRLLRREGERPDVLGAMREGDLLVHHPYVSFSTSVERFVEQAVADPNVLAIKQTVYRTSDDSPLVPALIDATERGKQAVALVELQARFDERMNIHWAKALEEAGVHVVYGQPALKTHAKCVLVVRREGDGVRNYVHIGTGNYHSATARLYTDFGLFTTDEQIGADVADMFNYLTGYGRPLHYRKVLIAPEHLREGIVEQIERTIAAHSVEHPARITMKMNSLVDGRCIRALYAASQAGVRVDLNVRGICCLRPRVPGISENIRVVSIVGRLLEHSRVYSFERNGDHEIYIASADLMPRNLDHRVELAVPIEAQELREELMDTLERAFADNQNSWDLDADGLWHRNSPGPGDEPRSLQLELADLYAARARSERPSDELDALRLPPARMPLHQSLQ
ncbi:MAG TPA: polyphosphate kinase 1 [Solirubrobacteraceae bacterium]|jgi:polyphosphate kinase|nr:polyphosphate kinase 1 [Solirubrobacteraceae bacterium]HEV3033400.1 polyphosphate kinase 1 [Solirubrobacteraceae bacterium]